MSGTPVSSKVCMLGLVVQLGQTAKRRLYMFYEMHWIHILFVDTYLSLDITYIEWAIESPPFQL
jgi:hypothetical protein